MGKFYILILCGLMVILIDKYRKNSDIITAKFDLIFFA